MLINLLSDGRCGALTEMTFAAKEGAQNVTKRSSEGNVRSGSIKQSN